MSIDGSDSQTQARPTADGRDGPLTGIVVADFSRVLAGPYATMMLGDLGATVIKVERPGGGDETRAWGPPYIGDESTYYVSTNRNKRSIILDLASPEGASTAQELATRADVLIENFLPGRLGLFGLDAETLLARCPKLIYCSITGFGDDQQIPGYDFVIQASAGLMSITGDAEGTPYKVGVAVVDVLTGLNAVIAILAALRVRERTGLGQHVSISLFSTLLSSLANQMSEYINTGNIPLRLGNRHPSVVPYETVDTADRPVALAVGNDRQFAQLCEVIDKPELSRDPRFATNAARVGHHDELLGEIRSIFRSATAKEWTDRLSAVGVPVGTVNDLEGAIEFARELGIEPVVSFENPFGPSVATICNPINLSVTPVSYRRSPPKLGADTEDVLAWLDGRAELKD